MNTLELICDYWQVDPEQRSPIEIPDFGRANLPEIFNLCKFKTGVELGVERGLFTEVLAAKMPDCKIVGVDAWTAYKGYRDHVSQGKLDEFYIHAGDRLQAYPNVELMRAFSDEATKEFPDGSLDWVYIDANHEWAHVTFDIYAWAKKVRPGGIVSGHDYYKSKRKNTKNHVFYVVNAYMQAFRIEPWFVLGTKEKAPDKIRDDSRSWLFVKDGR